MLGKFVSVKWNLVQLTLFVLLCWVGLSASANDNIPADISIQPPTRYVWLQNFFPLSGFSEQALNSYHVYSSPNDALDPQREGLCLEQGGVWLCHQNEKIPSQDGWLWGFRFCRSYEPDYCGWKGASMHGVCPSNITGFYVPSTFGGGWYHGYIACPVPSYPDGEKDLAKPQSCGERTPNPVHIGLGRKEVIQSIYKIWGGQFPIDFQLYYQHNDSKRLGVTWRHTYYKFIVLDGQEIPTSARVYRGKGAFLFYKDQTTGEWHSDNDIKDSLIELVNANNQRTGWIYADRFSDKTEHYDASGRLISIEDRSGFTHTLSYNSNGNLVNVTDIFGRQLRFIHDAYGNFATLTDLAGDLYQFIYESNGNLTSITYPDGRTRIYHYNEPAHTSNTNLPHALTGITDENGIRYATYTYDGQSRAIITEHAGGTDRYMLTYSADGGHTIVTDPLGSQYVHQFQTILGVARSTGQSQPAGAGCTAASSATTYDINGNVASRTDFNGNKTCYAFDLNRNLEIVHIEGLAAGSSCPDDLFSYTPATNSSERKILTDWHATFRLPVRMIEASRETSLDYDAHGNLTQFHIKDTTTGASRSWATSYIYHPVVPGVIVQRIEDGPRTDVADVTTIDYYAPDAICTNGHSGCRDQVARITNALGHVTQISRYSAHGQPEEIIDPNGLRTVLTYDTRQRLLTRASGTETTRYQYDKAGQLIQLTRPDNSTLTYTYDDAYHLIKITDRLGNTIHYTLDAMGNYVKEEILDAGNVLSKTQRQEFDALSRLWKMIGAQNQTAQFSYDPNGNLTQTIDALHHTANNRFDALNRLIQSTDPAGGQILQNYDDLDKITKVTDPRSIDTIYMTNVLGDILQEISADRGTITYTYDAAGNQITRTDARGVIQTTTYDALDRPIGQSYITVVDVPDTAVTTWRYDEGTNGIGRLTGMNDESGITTYQYDVYGRLLNKTQTIHYGKESFTHALSYQYDNSGRLNQTIYPSGIRINTFYDIDGHPVEIHINDNVLMHDIAYYPFGAPKSWVWGNGQPYNRSYDLDGRLTQHSVGTDIQTLTYDAAGRIIGTSQTSPIYNRSFEYDVLGRLIRQADNISTRLWGYDANSNRTHEQSGSMIFPYMLDTGSNHLLQVAGPVARIYTYDAAGNPLTDGITHYAWDASGRLSKTMLNNKVSDNLYNGLGERLLKIGSRSAKGKPYLYFYDSTGQLIGDYEKIKGAKQTTNWIPKQETIWLGDIPIAVIRQSVATEPVQVFYIYTDYLNTPRLIVNQSNTPVWRWDNVYAFGSNLPYEDPDGDGQSFEYNLRFPGQYFDKETGLHYNYFRYYEPETGRYLSSDPIGVAGGLNTYGYANGNPINRLDPFGLSDVTFDRGRGTIIIYDNKGNQIGQFPAGNNTASKSNGPWPNGIFPYSHYVLHPKSGPTGPYGSNGNHVFSVPGRIGMGIHSGRSGPQSKTLGCIRTTDEATEFLRKLNQIDPLRTITVK